MLQMIASFFGMYVYVVVNKGSEAKWDLTLVIGLFSLSSLRIAGSFPYTVLV